MGGGKMRKKKGVAAEILKQKSIDKYIVNIDLVWCCDCRSSFEYLWFLKVRSAKVRTTELCIWQVIESWINIFKIWLPELLAVGKSVEFISKMSSVCKSKILLYYYKNCFVTTTTSFSILQSICDALLQVTRCSCGVGHWQCGLQVGRDWNIYSMLALDNNENAVICQNLFMWW